jgi:Holliday junction resolvase
VSTKSKAKGTAAEREVVRYLQNWWPAAERRALSGNKDKGDVAGIADLVVEVKAAATQQVPAWKRETLTEMENAGVGNCMLVVKRPRKGVAEWDAYIPLGALGYDQRQHLPEEAPQWVRMDLLVAVLTLKGEGY